MPCLCSLDSERRDENPLDRQFINVHEYIERLVSLSAHQNILLNVETIGFLTSAWLIRTIGPPRPVTHGIQELIDYLTIYLWL
jgi:hypothetical protein